MPVSFFRITYYTLISILFSSSSFFLIRILNNHLLCCFLDYREICYIPSLLAVEYCNGLETNWTEGSLIFIHTAPYLLFLLSGIYIPHFIRKGHWALRLAVTWICFHMVLLFTGGLISGLFEYRGLGIPVTWFFVNKAIRITGVLILLAVIGFSVRRFGWYWIRCAPEPYFLKDVTLMGKWLWVGFSAPLFVSGILIICFTGIDLMLNHVMSFITGIVYFPVILGTLSKVYLSYNG